MKFVNDRGPVVQFPDRIIYALVAIPKSVRDVGWAGAEIASSMQKRLGSPDLRYTTTRDKWREDWFCVWVVEADIPRLAEEGLLTPYRFGKVWNEETVRVLGPEVDRNKWHNDDLSARILRGE